MEQQIKLAAKLYRCRDAAKKIFQDGYKAKISWYIQKLKRIMSDNGLDELKSVIWISENMKETGQDGFAMMMFTAAAVEMIEPSNDVFIG